MAQENWDSIQINLDPKKDAEEKAGALKAAQAFWIDALCVPQEEPARTSCLQSMGAIYSSAWQVFVVLPTSCSNVFKQIRETKQLDATALFTLESDDWISRAWTYQEIVNSQAVYFLVQGDEKTIVPGTDFLSAVLTTTDNFKNAHDLDLFDWSEQHPKLESLESLIADYRIANFGARSAYQVMSSMHPRLAEREEDHFYAMVGAISTALLDNESDLRLSPSEYFMRVCQTKNDFSFIYTTAPRDDAQGRRWCPVEGKYPPIVPGLLVSGDGQSGLLTPTHVQLNNMSRLHPVVGGLEGFKMAAKLFLPPKDTASSPKEIVDAILVSLKKKGFSGCGEYMELENGLFFPQHPMPRTDNLLIAISYDVKWVGGCPGMLLHSNGTDIHEFCDVGVFIGEVPKHGETLCVG